MKNIFKKKVIFLLLSCDEAFLHVIIKRYKIEVKKMNQKWHLKKWEDIEIELNTKKEGLNTLEAQKRLLEYGKNELPKTKKKSILNIFFEQFLNPLVFILIVTGIISIFAKEYIDALFILFVILMDAVVGTFQEWKAEKNAASLQNMMKIKAKIIRNNQMMEIDSEELVLGDIVHLESGDKIGADIRFTHTANLSIDEAFLTGESIAASKQTDVLPNDVEAHDQSNMGFAGSTVLSGRGTGIVVATGTNTELGKIAHSVNSNESSKTPLVIRMEQFTKQISILIVIIAIIITFILYLTGMAPREIFFTVVALSISAIPEGLPVSLTIALSIAANKMLKKNIIVRKLNAVEGLGSCTVIATDKTGTLTLNEQTAKIILLPNGKTHMISGQGYNGNGNVGNNNDETTNLITMGILNNEASLYTENHQWIHHGDSIDVALLSLGYKIGINPSIRNEYSIVGEIPYESEKKYSAVFFTNDNKTEVTVKGSLETILPFCKDMNIDNKNQKLDKNIILKQNEELASHGYRVIAFAKGIKDKFVAKENYDESDLPNLTFLGLIGFIDPIRTEVPSAIEECKKAGIKVVMITGDHPLTAKAIGKNLGLLVSEEELTTGEELLKHLEQGFEISDAFIKSISIFSRVTPVQKLAIVESFQRQGEFVAVTGDGVNDAPAMKCANIGIAMGSGTEVAKEVGSLIIADDKFNSIVSGVEEGRIAYNNIRKVIYMLLSCGISEILFFVLALICKMPIPLTAIQLLWLNLVTDGIQDIALAFERCDKNVMNKPPRKSTESIFNTIMIQELLLSGIIIGITVFGFWFYLINYINMDITLARSYILLLMVFMQNIHVFNCRSETKSILKQKIKNNPFIVFGIITTLTLQLFVTENDFLSSILKVKPIDSFHIILTLLLTIPLLVIMELFKLQKRKKQGV